MPIGAEDSDSEGAIWPYNLHFILLEHLIAEEGMVLATNEPRHFELEVVE